MSFSDLLSFTVQFEPAAWVEQTTLILELYILLPKYPEDTYELRVLPLLIVRVGAANVGSANVGSCPCLVVPALSIVFSLSITPLGDVSKSFQNILGLLTVINVFPFFLFLQLANLAAYIYTQLRFRNHHSNNQYPWIYMCKERFYQLADFNIHKHLSINLWI